MSRRRTGRHRTTLVFWQWFSLVGCRSVANGWLTRDGPPNVGPASKELEVVSTSHQVLLRHIQHGDQGADFGKEVIVCADDNEPVGARVGAHADPRGVFGPQK